jgi:hypothetical protein
MIQSQAEQHYTGCRAECLDVHTDSPVENGNAKKREDGCLLGCSAL